MLTPDQLALRRTGVTATDISAVVGLNPYQSAMAIYLAKIGKPIEREETLGMWAGKRLEALIAERYSIEHDCPVCHNLTLSLAHPDNPRLVATPDACIPTDPPYKGGAGAVITGWPSRGSIRYGLEIKTAFAAPQVKRWGKGGDQVPEEYLIQCQWCMLVCGLDRWDMAVLLGTYHGLDFRTYTLTADKALQDKLVEIAERFWQDNVEARKPPHPSGYPIDRAALAALYPEDTTPIAPSNDATDAMMIELKAALADEKAAKHAVELLKQELKGEAGNAEGIEGRHGRVTWKANKNGSRVFRHSLK